MADLRDIETALVNLCASAIYPAGAGSASAVGIDCKIFPGWPNQNELKDTLLNGLAEVTVYSGQNLERVTTRFSRGWYDIQTTPALIAAMVSGNTVTLGGTIRAADYVSLIIAGTAESYLVTEKDSLVSIAVALSSRFRGAIASGPSITFDTRLTDRIVARTAAPGVIGRELGRQQRGMMISVWAPSPQSRSSISTALMRIVQGTDFIAMPDGTQAWLTYR